MRISAAYDYVRDAAEPCLSFSSTCFNNRHSCADMLRSEPLAGRERQAMPAAADAYACEHKIRSSRQPEICP